MKSSPEPKSAGNLPSSCAVKEDTEGALPCHHLLPTSMLHSQQMIASRHQQLSVKDRRSKYPAGAGAKAGQSPRNAQVPTWSHRTKLNTGLDRTEECELCINTSS